MTTKKTTEEIKKSEKFVLVGQDGKIKKIIFPHDIQVGLQNSVFPATISGSIHHTREGKSYLVAGSGMSISSASNGQVTITFDVDGSTLTTSNSDVDQILINDGGAFKRIAPGNINISSFNNDSGFTSTVGDITQVIAGTGLSGGGAAGAVTLNLDFSELTDMTGDIAGTTEFILQDSTTESRKAASEIKLSNFNNDAGFTTTTGTVTEVTVGTGLDVSNGTTTPNITLDLSELTDMTSDVVGTQDELILLDNGSERRKLISEITLSDFDNDSGFVTENTMGSGFVLEDGDGTEVTITENKEVKFVEGTGIEINWTDVSPGSDSDPYDLTFSVDVSDFMTNGVNNRIVTATGTDGMNAESNLTFDGSDLTVSGRIMPGADDTYDIGDLNNAWQDLFLEGNIYFLDASTIQVVTGDLELDVSGDITLDANGGQIHFKDNTTTYLTFNVNGSTDSIEATGNLALDATGDITLSADGDQIKMDDGTTTRFTFNLDSTPELDVAGNFILDCSGDITLDADGSQIYFKDGGTTRFTFNLDSTPELDVAGNFTLDCTGDIEFNADGGDITFKDGSTTLASINSAGDFTANSVQIGSTNEATESEFIGRGTSSNDPVVRIRQTNTTDSNTKVGLVVEMDQTAGLDSTERFISFHQNSTILGSINANGPTYGTFTGSHIGTTKSTDTENWEIGMILKSTGQVITPDGGISLAWVYVDVTTTNNDKAVCGVVSSVRDLNGEPLYGFGDFPDTQKVIDYNGLGEGRILVTDTNGNIEVGDFICSSSKQGLGERQSDDILRNYTVAKANEAVDWSEVAVENGIKKKLIACTYHCG